MGSQGAGGWACGVAAVAESGSFIASPVVVPIDLSGLDFLGAHLDVGNRKTLSWSAAVEASIPFREASGHLWLLASGSYDYEYFPDGGDYRRTRQSPFAFLVEADATGAVLGFLGGPEDDFPALGRKVVDYCLDSAGRLLVLRGDGVERYLRRP